MTCGEALRQLFAKIGDTILTAEEVYQRLQETPDNPCSSREMIGQRLRKYSVNHKYMKHLKNMQRRSFLFWVGDDQFRNWSPARDGRWVRVNGEMQVDGAGDDLEEVEPDDELAAIESPVSLSIERDLEDCLAQNIALVEAGLKLYTRDGVSGRQYNTKAVGIIDLLGVDKEGRLVVIELKAGEAGDKACAQLYRYMGWVEANLAIGKPVRGILVASDFSEGCRYAIKAAPAAQLKRYEVQFKFSPIPNVGEPEA